MNHESIQTTHERLRRELRRLVKRCTWLAIGVLLVAMTIVAMIIKLHMATGYAEWTFY